MTIIEAKRKHEARWLQLPGVVSVGIGQSAEGQAAIKIGLDRERPDTRRKIPSSIEGHPIIVEVSGNISAL